MQYIGKVVDSPVAQDIDKVWTSPWSRSDKFEHLPETVGGASDSVIDDFEAGFDLFFCAFCSSSRTRHVYFRISLGDCGLHRTRFVAIRISRPKQHNHNHNNNKPPYERSCQWLIATVHRSDVVTVGCACTRGTSSLRCRWPWQQPFITAVMLGPLCPPPSWQACPARL